MIRSALFALASALVLLAAAPPARAADDVAEARARFRKGAELYRAGRWRDAIVELEAAYRLKPHGAIHFNIAQCREKLAEWPGALRSYSDYLREVPDAKDRAAVRAAIVRIERRLAAAGVQALLVYSDPPGAAVTLDGRQSGTTPFHAVLPPGRYQLALSLDGYEPVKQEVALQSASSRTVDVVLRPATSAEAAPPLAAAPPARAAPAPGPQAAQVPPPPDLRVSPPKASAPVVPSSPPPRPGEKRRVYTWIAAGAAVVALAAGGYYRSAASKDASAVRSSVAPSTTDPAQLQAYQAGLDKKIADSKSKQRTANVLFATGAGAAAAGVTLFFVEKRF